MGLWDGIRGLWQRSTSTTTTSSTTRRVITSDVAPHETAARSTITLDGQEIGPDDPRHAGLMAQLDALQDVLPEGGGSAALTNFSMEVNGKQLSPDDPRYLQQLHRLNAEREARGASATSPAGQPPVVDAPPHDASSGVLFEGHSTQQVWRHLTSSYAARTWLGEGSYLVFPGGRVDVRALAGPDLVGRVVQVEPGRSARIETATGEVVLTVADEDRGALLTAVQTDSDAGPEQLRALTRAWEQRMQAFAESIGPAH